MNMVKKSLVNIGVFGVLAATGSLALAHQQGDWIVRAGVAHVAPNDDSGDVSNLGVVDPALATGVEVEVEDDTSLGLTIAYMLTNHWALGLLGSYPFEHDIEGSGAINGISVGSTKHLPPTLTLQYHFTGSETTIQPYVGAGLNFTGFFEEDVDPELVATLQALNPGLGITDVDLELDDSWGLALEAGVDWKLGENWMLNTAVWYIDIETDATLETNLGTIHEVDVDIDPWVYMVGVGYRF